jgi:putative transposase
MKMRSEHEDYHSRISTAIANHYDTIIIEDLNVQGMHQNHHTAENIGDSSFYSFKQKLPRKADKYRKNLVEIGRFDPSSKLC